MAIMKQCWHLQVNEYYLFSQDYRKGNKEIFSNKVFLSELRKLKKHHSHSVRNTVEKIPNHIRYIEKEYGISLLERSKESKKYYTYNTKRFDYAY